MVFQRANGDGRGPDPPIRNPLILLMVMDKALEVKEDSLDCHSTPTISSQGHAYFKEMRAAMSPQNECVETVKEMMAEVMRGFGQYGGTSFIKSVVSVRGLECWRRDWLPPGRRFASPMPLPGL